MKLHLDRLADRGCWISDDRVNAFISLTESGISEIGYHGTQPVSKNSRILVGSGKCVLSFGLRGMDGAEHPISFREVEWTPSRVTVNDRACELEISAFQRSILCSVRPHKQAQVVFSFSLGSLNRDTQGTRSWSEPEVLASSVVLSCNDRIVLNEWLNRTGPYAGDFLIPEPLRRTIFNRQVRSGEASLDDLRPEFRDAGIPIYDASVFVRIGCNEAFADRGDGVVKFAVKADKRRPAEFVVQFGDRRSDIAGPLPALSPVSTREPVVSIDASEYPSAASFMTTVPPLVQSAIVLDHGMPRATPAAYYWIWAWDSLVTGIEMLRWGDYSNTRRMAQFINAHRDDGGLIPGRWTRSLQPLDTPPRGSLEFLFATFVYQHALETGDYQAVIEAYPFLLRHLEEIAGRSDASGMFPGSGFYPDFTAKFGRSASSVVAMEVAAHYTFLRLVENISSTLRDKSTEAKARETADQIEIQFLDRFWDDDRGFLIDSYDMRSGAINKSYPLFTMLFLQSSLGVPLIRSRIDTLARFCSQELLGAFGTSLLPSWDRNRMNEDATASWYPHWDVYLIKILRRAGRSEGIMQWLGNVERVLSRLGYCPEFIKLDNPDPDDPSAWLNHGAISNLNCVTGWFRSIVEGLFGLEIDPGGLSVIPLSFPIESISISGLMYRGGSWNVTVRNEGRYLEALIIDGSRWEGICKVPVHYYDGSGHEMEVVYGSSEPDLQFREIINAEVIDVKRTDDSRTVTIRPLGTCDVVLYSRRQPNLLLDGKELDFEFDEQSGIGHARIQMKNQVDLTIVAD